MSFIKDLDAPGALDALADVPWPAGQSSTVEFYVGIPVPVTVVDSTDPALPAYLSAFADDRPMGVDLEWKPDHGNAFNPIAVFQFCSTKGVLVVLNDLPGGTPALKAFLTAHHFFGKGMSYDHFKLRTMFECVFQIEDIQESRIIPHDLPVNFVDLVAQVIGLPVAQFKDKLVSSSDWSARPLSTKQILYSAFDAYATFRIYQVLRERFGEPDIIETDIVMKRKKDKVPGGVRAKGSAVTVKLGKPKFDLTVQFVDLLEYACLLRINEEDVFVERPSYGPQMSLFEYLRAYDEIEKVGDHFTCNLCHTPIDDPIDHAWMVHYDLIPAVYYPDQSPSYLESLLRQIHLANEHAEILADDKLKCRYCGKAQPSFHTFYTHCRLVHFDESATGPAPSPWALCLEYLDRTGKASHRECRICESAFATDADFEAHCWRSHGHEIAFLLKHRPVNYSDGTFASAFRHGVVCLNEVTVGQICHGSIACGLCKIGFDDPGELFIHLFHRHTRLCAVSARAIDIWPLPASALPPDLLDVLRRCCMGGALRALRDAGIFEGGRCAECRLELAGDDAAWRHAVALHLAVLF
jgi:hypothetical protein